MEREAMTAAGRDVMTPREAAGRSGFSYAAVLRAIRRGDLKASEPIPGNYRIDFADYDTWLHRPLRQSLCQPARPVSERPPRPRKTTSADRGSFARLRAIENG